ncbi:MAG: beta-ketoacyl synthase N-terminal-like domain-containing protein, partial [Micromonosporaceae bacterium]
MAQDGITGNEIAIIGLAARFPGAPDAAGFWRNLCDGVESISFFDDAELEVSPLFGADVQRAAGFVAASGVIEGAQEFDPGFFGLSLREARWMDPQQRVFLQLAWAALEDAGYDPGRCPDRISVYAGAASSGHQLALLSHMASDPASAYEGMGSASAENLATKVSYLLRLRGESMNVHTACSTGLAAVHLACQSLLLGQSRMAIAGAARISLPQRTGYLHQEGMILAPDGHCRAFDHRAAGTVPGNGVGVVVLKPLSNALADSDQIYAVLKGSAINNEGHRSVGYTAPSVAAQAEVIAEALAFAEVSAADIGYVEAHGTGTPLGDPIEIAALTKAYRRSSDRVADCPIGSVKTNIGHTDTAAGIAGLIKVALMLRHGEIPPSLHLEQPNPAIDFGSSPFTVNTTRRPWSAGATPRRAGVSSFGIGGTNVHAVLEEAP